jgi:hypothetical protein
MSVTLSKIKNQTGEAIFPATLHGKFIERVIGDLNPPQYKLS